MTPACTPARCRCDSTHTIWQQQVIDLAHMLGWQHLHVRRTIGAKKQWVTSTNRKGWPDLFLWHPAEGFAAIELKCGADKATAEQTQVLAELAAAGAATMVAFPHDLDAVVALLRPKRLASTQ